MILTSMLIMYILFLPLVVSSFTLQPTPSSKRHCTFQNNQHEFKLLTIASSTTSLHHAAAAVSNINEDGKCKFGTKEYWDTMYTGNNNDDDPLSSSESNNTNDDGLSAEEYSWYCNYRELQPFWDMLVGTTSTTTNDDTTRAKEQTQVLIAGIGNDITPIQMYDDGWANMIAFDYSESGVCRARELFGPTRLLQSDDDVDTTNHDNDDGTVATATGCARLLVADCRELPIPTGTIDATLDKGTLDAIYITGKEVLLDSVKELTRVTAVDGIIICVSAVIPQEELLDAFLLQKNNEEEGESGGCGCCWETVLDGGLAFADSGEATIDLGANLYSFRRR